MFAFGIIATLILAPSFSVMRIAIPRLVDEGFGRCSHEASVLLGMCIAALLLFRSTIRSTIRSG